ncbi:MAG TPA: hypothetical protein PKJ43_07235 [Prolixibacteraceae bacterium]|nr:hypothetical protein [Prolixibacteraceae bacterium]
MGTSKFVSDVKIIKHNNVVVYNFLSDFNNLRILFNEYTLAQLSKQLPNMEITNCVCDADSCLFTLSNNSQGGVKIIEREHPKTIKLTGEGKLPFEMFFWIQLLPTSAYETKIRLTLHAELNMMLKMLAGKKLKDGLDKIADALTMLPYH